MNRDDLDTWCERGILALVLAILVFGPLATGAVRSLEFLIVQGLTMGVMLLWGLRIWLAHRTKFLWPPICWAVIAFAAYAVARYLTCDIEYVGRKELIRVLVYAFLFFAILNNLHGQNETQIISFTMIFLAMGISCYAVYQLVTGSDHVWHFITRYKGRGGGTYICPNHLAGFLEMLLPLALTYTLAGRSRPVTKVFLGYAALVMVAGVGATVSRGGWVACGMSLMVLFGILAWHRSYRLPSLLLLAVLVAGSTYLVANTSYFKQRFAQTLPPGDLTQVETDLRFQLWEAAVRMWRDHFWFGVGPAHYNFRFAAYRPETVQVQPDRVHNDYLNVPADWGIVGAGIVAAGLTALSVGLVKTWRHVRREEKEFKSNRSNKFAFVLGATVGLLALAFHSVTDFNLQIPANAILATSLAALLSSHLRFATEQYWVTARVWGKVLASAVLLAGLVFLLGQEVRLGREYVWRDRALHAPDFSPAQKMALRNAFAAEPMNSDTAYILGDILRVESFEGGDETDDLANEALEWFARGSKANPYEAYNYLRHGMCLDWLGRHDEAEKDFDKVDELEPNSFFAAAHIGWHYIQVENYAAARPWLERSLRLKWKDNEKTANYLPIVHDRMLRAATNQIVRPSLGSQ